METTVLSAVSALVGSVVGLSASAATTWVTQRTQARRMGVAAEIKKREELYAEFIAECSKLAIDSLDHSLEHPDKILTVYALANRIRLCASGERRRGGRPGDRTDRHAVHEGKAHTGRVEAIGTCHIS
ncbi:MAG: hypothetical protein IPK39_12180 [Sulfuritalea sp.]|nr:hypothetical protein [Sulfuritalea sp.]